MNRGRNSSGSIFVALTLFAAAGLPWGCSKEETPRAPRRARAPAARPAHPGTCAIVTDADFDGFTASGVVLVDFWSPSCPPCLKQGPIVERLAARFEGRAFVGKIDVAENRDAPRRFGVRYIPTLIVFKEGREVRRFTGLQEEAVLASALEEVLR
jgi:thioredoxin 1